MKRTKKTVTAPDPSKPTSEQIQFVADLAEGAESVTTKRFERLFPGFTLSPAVLTRLDDSTGSLEFACGQAWICGIGVAPRAALAMTCSEWIRCLIQGEQITLPINPIESLRVKGRVAPASDHLEVQPLLRVSSDFLSGFVAPMLLAARPFPFSFCEFCRRVGARAAGQPVRFCGRTGCLEAARAMVFDGKDFPGGYVEARDLLLVERELAVLGALRSVGAREVAA